MAGPYASHKPRRIRHARPEETTVTLPDQQKLIDCVVRALEEATPGLAGGKKGGRGWVGEIGPLLKKHLQSIDPSIECAYGRDAHTGDEKEWLFDFVACLCDRPKGAGERYLMQALVVGEVECHSDLERDFEKLLVVDSLVLFFAFPEGIQEHGREDELKHFEQVARKRVQQAATRGIKPLPLFVIARRSASTREFTIRLIGGEQ